MRKTALETLEDLKRFKAQGRIEEEMNTIMNDRIKKK